MKLHSDEVCDLIISSGSLAIERGLSDTLPFRTTTSYPASRISCACLFAIPPETSLATAPLIIQRNWDVLSFRD